MDILKDHFGKLLVLIALALFGSVSVAQGPPNNPCASSCLQSYQAAVKACQGNPACLAAARAALEGCVGSCR